jgi:hypothetical protein
MRGEWRKRIKNAVLSNFIGLPGDSQASHSIWLLQALSFGPVRQNSSLLQRRKECWCQAGSKKHKFGSEVVI